MQVPRARDPARNQVVRPHCRHVVRGLHPRRNAKPHATVSRSVYLNQATRKSTRSSESSARSARQRTMYGPGLHSFQTTNQTFPSGLQKTPVSGLKGSARTGVIWCCRCSLMILACASRPNAHLFIHTLIMCRCTKQPYKFLPLISILFIFNLEMHGPSSQRKSSQTA